MAVALLFGASLVAPSPLPRRSPAFTLRASARPTNFLKFRGRLGSEDTQRWIPRAKEKSREDFFESLQNTLYGLDSSRDEIISRLKTRFTGTNPLEELSRDDYFIKPGDWVLITGATEGIGKETASFLAKLGAKITILGRNKAKGDSVVQELQRLAPESSPGIAFVEADLGSIKSVFGAVKEIEKDASVSGEKIKCLINNAGVWPTDLKITEDGLESAFQVNHLSHFLLTTLLRPYLSKPARVVTTSSLAHAFELSGDFSDLNWKSKSFNSNTNYGRSKLANLLFAKHLAIEMPEVTSVAIHPGLVATQLFRDFSPALSNENYQTEAAKLVEPIAYAFFKTPEEGARTLIYATVVPQILSGSYLVDCEIRPVGAAGRNINAAKHLWELSERLVDDRMRAEELPGSTTSTTSGVEPSTL